MATVVCPSSSPTPGVLDNPRTAQQPPFVTRLGMRRSREAICEHFLANLENYPDVAVGDPEFVQSVRQHFALLPSRYALDVNTDGLDVLNHKRLLEEVRKDPSAVYFQVRAVEVNVPVGHVGSPSGRDLHQAGSRHTVSRGFPRPAFGSSPNLQALAIEAGAEREHVVEADVEAKIFFEITVASADQPKLLCRLTDVLGDVGLDICEAHAFNTSDKYSLDIFVVDGWDTEGKEELEEALRQRFSQMPPPPSQVAGSRAEGVDPLQDPPIPRTAGLKLIAEEMQNPDSPGKDEWEIDISQLEIESKISAGSFGTLYRGIYCGQEVAVKIMKDVQESEQQLQEFLQEVTIMRRVRHKNVVQFIGACTRKPNLCMLFEYMSCGSLYDYLRSEGPPRHALLLKIALDISRGMDYLHQNNIIHRDLKSTNILLDENHTVKIADFGVARIVDQDGVMTAETGTYRWMAPEVIEHRSYGEKVDVFSFAIVLWELLTAKVPYSTLTPLQAAVGVVQKGLRPEIPAECPQQLGQLMESCWSQAPEHRPSFREVTGYLQQMQQALQQEAASPVRPPPRGGFFSKFRSSGGGRQ